MVRKLSLVGVAVTVMLVVAATGIAGHITSDVESYTGCLVSGEGVIIKVKEGNTPKSACTGGQALVHLSGGDITKISVSGALSGGGDSGEVTISLKPEFSLPQTCESFEFAMWSDGSDRWICADHRNGTGLQLTQTISAGSGAVEYGIGPSYRVKNTPDCSSGQFATGFDDDGDIQCAAPSASLQSFQSRQTSFLSGDGVPDDGADRTFVTLAVPGGTYLVNGKGVLSQGDDDTPTFSTTGGNFGCGLGNVPAEFTRFFGKDNDEDEYGFALTGIVTTSGEALTLRCFADPDYDQITIRNGTLAAVKVG